MSNNKKPEWQGSQLNSDTNKILKKPKFKNEVIFSLIDQESQLIEGGHFVPTWDGTDHLQFACDSCKNPANILYVETVLNVETPTLCFYLGCPKCGKTGQRKTYLTPVKNQHFNHTSVFGDKVEKIHGEDLASFDYSP